jgi:hypothetical protein
MATWDEFTAQAVDLAAGVRECFAIRKHCTMATVRRDGAPRISGIEVGFSDGQLWLGMMPGSMKALDLLRDGRVAVHSPTIDAPESDPAGWAGEAKVAGRAVEVGSMERPGDGAEGLRFHLDLTEVVLTRIGDPADHLLITSWHADRGLAERKRY